MPASRMMLLLQLLPLRLPLRMLLQLLHSPLSKFEDIPYTIQALNHVVGSLISLFSAGEPFDVRLQNMISGVGHGTMIISLHLVKCGIFVSHQF